MATQSLDTSNLDPNTVATLSQLFGSGKSSWNGDAPSVPSPQPAPPPPPQTTIAAPPPDVHASYFTPPVDASYLRKFLLNLAGRGDETHGAPMLVTNASVDPDMAKQAGLPPLAPVGKDSKGNPLYSHAEYQQQNQDIATFKKMQVMTGLRMDRTNPVLGGVDQIESRAPGVFTDDEKQAMLNSNPNGFTQSALDKAVGAKRTLASAGYSYIGNTPDGKPVLMDKAGNFQTGQGTIVPKSSTMPTSSTRSSAEFATTLLPHIQQMRALVSQADAKGFIGPAAGRVYGQFLGGTVGSTGDADADKLLGQLKSMDSLLKTGAMRVHFGARGGQQMYDHFSDMLNSGKQSAAMLNGSLDTLQNFMEGYASAGQPGGAATTPPQTPAAPQTPQPAPTPKVQGHQEGMYWVYPSGKKRFYNVITKQYGPVQ